MDEVSGFSSDVMGHLTFWMSCAILSSARLNSALPFLLTVISVEPPAQPEAAILNKEEVMLMKYSFSQRPVASPRGLAL